MRRSLLFVAIAVLAVVILLTVAKKPEQVENAANVESSAPASEAPAGEAAPAAEALPWLGPASLPVPGPCSRAGPHLCLLELLVLARLQHAPA